MKKAISIILYLIFVASCCIGGYAVITRLISTNQGYLSFVATDEAGNLIRTSIDNDYVVGEKVRINTKYLYDNKSHNNNTDFNVHIESCAKNDFNYVIDNKKLAFNYVNYNKEFNLVKGDGYFEFVVPNINDLFNDAKDLQGNALYLGDIFSQDSFKLVISSYNDNTVIEYSFHFKNEKNVAVDNIDIGNDITVAANSKEVGVFGITIDSEINFK